MTDVDKISISGDRFTRNETGPAIGLNGRKAPGDLMPASNNHKPVVKGELLHPEFNRFCKWVNGYVDGECEDKSKHSYFSLRDLTKSIWFMYVPLQIAGLFSERAMKVARGFYGACWSIVYSCYRPWKENRDKLSEHDSEGKPVEINNAWKGIYNANEYFRMIMGSLVSAVYGGGAFGMLWSAISGNDDAFEKASKIYKVGMFNQNQIFASMNADVVMRRFLNPDQLKEVDKKKTGVKAMTEYVDTLLFIPNIITRALGTFELLGMELSEGVGRFVNFLAKFSYGTWATRFGIMKTSEEDGGDLEKLEKTNKALYHTQNYGGKVFCYTLPVLSWVSACAELFGQKDFAEKVFDLEGILERLNPMIAAWCLTNPWLQGYLNMISHSEVPNVSRAET